MQQPLGAWESPRWPPRSSSRWQPPGIYLNVEVGGVWGPEERMHTKTIKYTSKRMEEKLHEERIREQYEQRLLHTPHPPVLMPANGLHQERVYERQHRHQQQQRRQRSLGVRPREQHERGTSAPPAITNRRSEPISPISPVSPIGSIHPSSAMSYHAIPSFHSYPSPLRTANIPLPTSSPRSAASWERLDQALPPTPSQFRLGESDLPWSMPPWYRPPEPEFASPPPTSAPRREMEIRTDDPQRVRDLGTLHQAMMTVDSLGNDGWEPWTLDSVGDFPRGPRSIGWAVSSNDTDASRLSPAAAASSGPPPYVVSQWEQAFGRSTRRSRPRTSGT